MAGRFLTLSLALMLLGSVNRADAQWAQKKPGDRTNTQWGGFGTNQPSGNYPSDPQSDIVPGILGIIGKSIDAAIESDKHNNHNHNHDTQWNNQGPYYPPYQRPNTIIVQPQTVRPQTQTIYKPKVELKANAAPIAKPEPKSVQVAVARNSFSINGSNITAADVQNTKEDAKDHVDETIDDIRDDISDKLEDDVDLLEGYSDAEKREIKDRLKKGESVDDLIKAASMPPDAAERLLKADDAFDALEEIADDAKKGRLKPRDLNDFEDDFSDLVDSEDDLTDDLDVISEDSFWIDQMDSARPGMGGLPPGMGTQIIYVSNMPSGRIVNLGNGTVLVGTGGATSGVIMMTGSIAQVAGLSVGVGQPVPDTEVEPISSGVLLVNLGNEAVNYNVNSDQFSMTPDYRQVLPGDKTWTVEFDRGGDHGKAKYGIANGTFGFTPTHNGWELFEQPDFEVTIDNKQNQFAFHYVLDSTQQTVDAGQANQHTSRYPQVIRFDDGTGQERQKTLEKGEYVLAVTAEGTLDLFETSYVEPPFLTEQIAKASSVKGRSLLELDGKTRGGLFGGSDNSPKDSPRGLLNFR